ncbi:MAG: hypothetical protein HN350_22375 [Phycisphaerales bacterium]|jgi:hypothetical protein|nr:hypothetical protein [Phycisphaerales bacterium]
MNKKKKQQNQLAKELDSAVPPHKPSTRPGNDDPLLDAARKLATSEHPILSPEKLAQIEAKVLGKHAELHASGRLIRFATIQRALVMMTIMEVAVLVILFISLLPQIEQSAPGDWLYPLKRAGEKVEMTVANFTQNDATVQTELAERRAMEAVTLLGRGQINVALISEAVDHLSRAGEAAIATESPEFAAQAVKVSGLIVNVVERAGQNEALATEETISSLEDIMQTIHEDKNLPLPYTPTPTPLPFASDATTPTPIPPTDG